MPLPSHVAKTDNKTTPNKMFKINNQALYSQSLNYFARAIVMKNMHNHILAHIDTDVKIKKVYHLIYKFGVVINQNNIRFVKGKIQWKKPKKDFIPNWDADNLASIWKKAGNDALVMSGILKDDFINVINITSYAFEFVEELEDSFLEITLKYEE